MDEHATCLIYSGFVVLDSKQVVKSMEHRFPAYWVPA